jgi:glycerol-3-phosphate acyltransferase PlsY
MHGWSGIALAAFLSFCLGSLPFAWILGRAFLGIDIRAVASRNPGATNLWRVSRPLGVAALLLDAGKGLAATLVIGPLAALGAGSVGATAAGLGAVTGHIASPLLKFKGGKGVAVGVGVVAALVPWPTLIAVAAFVVMVVLFRYVSLGSITAAAAIIAAHFAITPAPFGENLAVTVFILVIAPLVIVRHHANIRRIVAGTENKIRFTRNAKNEDSAEREQATSS